MRHFLILVCFFFIPGDILFSQVSMQMKEKPPIDAKAIYDGIELDPNQPAIATTDGKFIGYRLRDYDWNFTYILQMINGNWRKILAGIGDGLFSSDNKRFIYQSRNTIYIQELGNDKLDSISGVVSFQLINFDDEKNGMKDDWLLWQSDNGNKNLVLQNLNSTKQRKFNSVNGYLLSGDKNTLLIKSVMKNSSDTGVTLKIIRLPFGDPVTIWHSDRCESLKDFVIDATGNQIVFMVHDLHHNNDDGGSIWYYKTGMKNAFEKVKKNTSGIEEGLAIDINRGVRFSRDVRYIYFNLREQALPRASAEAVQVDVWSYKDVSLQSTQLANLSYPSFTAVVSANDKKVIRLEGEWDKIVKYQEKGDFVLESNDPRGEKFWITKGFQYKLVSLKNGSSKTIQKDILLQQNNYWFSPEGRYFIYYKNENYFSYDLIENKEVNVSELIPKRYLTFFYNFVDSNNANFTRPFGIAGWLKGDFGVLVYDEYDIWLLDLSGKNTPINLTKGLGRTNHIKLRIADNSPPQNLILFTDSSILLTAFNVDNKYNGFYSLKFGFKSELTCLTMGPWTLDHVGGGNYFPENGGDFNTGMTPVKSGNGWIVKRSTVTDPPNYYWSDGLFIGYKKLTNINPIKDYNWLTTELINYPQLDGTMSQGILYKPENFDHKNKYPVIILYYEQYSHRLFEYPEPYFTEASINIPWFVSRGYLIFTPDIHYHFANLGESCRNSVEGAALFLARLPYVDGKRMGINGHSWGGAETNYLITHTHIFAAALEGSAGHNGVDLIGNSFSLSEDLSRYEYEDVGASLWEHPDWWISRSPIFQADQVSTPFLMMNNKQDNEWTSNVAFYIALRRLNKKVWMLQYDNGEHSLWPGPERLDFSIRVQQFFDHYLKGAPPPKWMTIGIPARLKGIDTGLELDPSGIQP